MRLRQVDVPSMSKGRPKAQEIARFGFRTPDGRRSYIWHINIAPARPNNGIRRLRLGVGVSKWIQDQHPRIGQVPRAAETAYRCVSGWLGAAPQPQRASWRRRQILLADPKVQLVSSLYFPETELFHDGVDARFERRPVSWLAAPPRGEMAVVTLGFVRLDPFRATAYFSDKQRIAIVQMARETFFAARVNVPVTGYIKDFLQHTKSLVSGFRGGPALTGYMQRTAIGTHDVIQVNYARALLTASEP